MMGLVRVLERRIRATGQHPSLEIAPGLKVRYISGYPAGSGSLRSIFEGGEHFLHKPFTIAELLDKVHNVLDAAV